MLDPAAHTDEEWLDLMIQGLEGDRDDLPSGPSAEVQARFVGWSGAAAMRECFDFYRLAKRLAPELAQEQVLDFGVGWGRLIRLFAHDVPEAQLYGVDVDAEIIDVCRETGVPGQLSVTSPGGPLPFPDATFGLAYAYSVFSHLSEDAARTAFEELARTIRPGGNLTFTTQGQRFLALCRAIRSKRLDGAETLSAAEASIDSFFADPFAASEQFDAGAHAYTGTGGSGVLTGDFYGWAAIPEPWLEANLPEFEVIDVTDDPAVNEQVVITLRRR